MEAYIRDNRHLAEIPSGKEIQTHGLDLGDNQAALLKKIEELTLYLIQQDKQLTDQQQKLETQTQKLDTQSHVLAALQARIHRLEKLITK